MSRDTTSAMNTEFAADVLRPLLLFEGLFDSGAVRFWTGIGSLTSGGNVYTGAGDFLGFSGFTETGALQAEGTNVSLSGIPTNNLSLMLNEEYQGRTVTLSLGAMDASNSLIADPYDFVVGKADTMTLEDDGQTTNITLAVESDLIVLHRVMKQLNTSERQQIDFPTDLGFDFVPSLQDASFRFGPS